MLQAVSFRPFIVALVATSACAKPAPAPTTPEPPAPAAGDAAAAPSSAQQEQPAPPAAPAPDPDVPIDPSQEMPEASLTTNATLVVDQPSTVMIDGRSDIYSSGMKTADEGRAGKLPSAITLAGAGAIQFTKVVGKSGCEQDASFGPDGGNCAGGNTNLENAGTFSGIVASDRTLFLVGMFVGAKPAKKAPARLDFSAGKQGVAFKELAPQVGQVFFIGDGKTGTGDGDVQTFKVPTGATMLYLGYADGFAFQGTPGAYGDNTGGLSVTLVQKGK